MIFNMVQYRNKEFLIEYNVYVNSSFIVLVEQPLYALLLRKYSKI